MQDTLYQNPKLIADASSIEPSTVTWQSPSNIALIKYWGKYGQQLPRNPSVSFTLKEAYTETKLSYRPRRGVGETIALTFRFEGAEKPAFKEKVQKFLESMLPIFPFLSQFELEIDSRNSFPHSAGIASSASSMSALALCLCTMEDLIFDDLRDDEAFRQKSSYVSRLGSGSACRSIYEKAAAWGKGGIEGSSDLFAVPFTGLHEVFQTFHDAILIVDKEEKSVSSRAGHALMEGNPFANPRYQQARQRFQRLQHALETGDLEVFGTIVEEEALTLHALMMTSSPSYLLMRPNTLEIIQRVRQYRRESNVPIYFTLDAGPNVHLLYPRANGAVVESFIEEELKPFCEGGQVILDQVGLGPVEL